MLALRRSRKPMPCSHHVFGFDVLAGGSAMLSHTAFDNNAARQQGGAILFRAPTLPYSLAKQVAACPPHRPRSSCPAPPQIATVDELMQRSVARLRIARLAAPL